ncbi:MAG: Bax inhibitor-1/YccA family protein [Spirochaetia bacterium]|nr:Bax inhibitor-1/YccA family protein [Spirochaetia bacterium]MCF7946681.1 Bax inhibitor-1/YccA family protein [Spirochaetia bacterium]MCF7953142.1 Bax inhibitor-1/YccA family protein [Spirochaetales bacterium]
MAISLEQVLSAPKVRERNILRNVYLWMTGGLALTGLISYTIASSQQLTRALLTTPGLFLILIIAEFGLVIYLSARIQKMKSSSAVAAFIGYAVLNGITLSVLLQIYTGLTISRAFFTTAGTFAGMSIYGMTTKRDLDQIGAYLVMGLWGIIIATVVNMLIGSSSIYYLISYLGLIIFLGLTAWDTQTIVKWNQAYGSSMDEETYVKLSIIGALKLYLDFINIFLFLLRIFGRRN